MAPPGDRPAGRPRCDRDGTGAPGGRGAGAEGRGARGQGPRRGEGGAEGGKCHLAYYIHKLWDIVGY